jgi:hypothetical protein
MNGMRTAFALCMVAAALAAGCGGDDRGTQERAAVQRPAGAHDASPREPPAQPVPARCLAGTTRSYVSRGVAVVLRRASAAYGAPGGRLLARFGLRNVNRVPTTFRVLAARVGADCRATWYHVQLPIRPNGSRGWIRADAARPYAVDLRIVVDLSDRTVSVYRAGKLVVETPTAIGKPGTPTPTGSYYVNQRLLAADPHGPWGPGGIGISAFSPVLTSWAQGGPIAIHGTNRPETIGHAASNGCLRIDNRVLTRLIELVPEGTPVRIRV